jgi:hypothetical protein
MEPQGFFQLIDDASLLRNKPWLFTKGTRLFVKDSGGDEKIQVQVGKQIKLALAGPLPKAVSVQSTKALEVEVSMVNAQQQFTITARKAAKSILTGIDADGKAATSPLLVVAGEVENHNDPKMEIDLIADICRGTDAVRIHALHRFLNDNDDNMFNENLEAIVKKRGPRACGTIAKDGGQALWEIDADAHAWNTYHIPFRVNLPPPPKKPFFAEVTDRNDVKFKKETVDRAKNAIAGWLLKKKKPVLVGVLYGPTAAHPMLRTNRFGQIERGGISGHTVMIVGCDEAHESFLYIDPWRGGSQLTYAGGIATDKFANKCSLGVLSLNKTDPVRGPMLRQTILTEGSFETSDRSFLEVISGP